MGNSMDNSHKIVMGKILDSINAGALIIDKDLKMVLHNKKLKEVFDSPQVLNPGFITNLFKENIDSYPITFKDIFSLEYPRSYMLRFNDGRCLNVLATYTEIGGREYIIYSFADVATCSKVEELETQVKEKEEQLKKKNEMYKLRYDYFVHLFHEAKTPINIISSSAHILEGELKDSSEKGEKYLDIIKRNCNRLIKEINNFMDIERLKSGYFTLDKEICNIVQIIEDISLSVLPFTENKGIDLTFDTEFEERFVEIDIYSLERIILNLLSNAIKFTKPGGKIFVLVKDLGENIELIIQDTGVGISEEDLPHIFKRFYKEVNINKDHHKGSGIGLYLVKTLVTMMGGKIFIESELGKGSIFSIKLPARPIEGVDGMVAKKPCRDIYYYKEKVDFELSDL